MAAATTIPQDIITEHILNRLPSKSVGRFRCVSKEWLSLLTDPQFIQSHQKTLNTNRFIFEPKHASLPPQTGQYTLTRPFILNSSNDNDSVPCYKHEAMSACYNNHEGVSSSTLTKLQFELELDRFSIDGSCNGLVLASGYTNSGKDFTRLVLNPTTKEYVVLPVPSTEQLLGMKGFGYDSVSGDYKVVCISIHGNFYGNVYVYNLTTNTINTWKQVARSPYCHNFSIASWSGVLVNGCLHWTFSTSDSKPIIVAFCLADEKLSEVPQPNLYNEVETFEFGTKMVAIGDNLGLFNEVKGDVWVMNEYGVETSWTKIICGFNGLPIYRPAVLCDNGKVLFLTGEQVWIYDVEEATFTRSDVSYMKIRYFIGAYAESLVSPKFSRSN